MISVFGLRIPNLVLVVLQVLVLRWVLRWFRSFIGAVRSHLLWPRRTRQLLTELVELMATVYTEQPEWHALAVELDELSLRLEEQADQAPDRVASEFTTGLQELAGTCESMADLCEAVHSGNRQDTSQSVFFDGGTQDLPESMGIPSKLDLPSGLARQSPSESVAGQPEDVRLETAIETLRELNTTLDRVETKPGIPLGYIAAADDRLLDTMEDAATMVLREFVHPAAVMLRRKMK